MSSDWIKLGQKPPAALLDARLEAHWAVQVPGAVGETWVEKVPDFGHLSLVWDRAQEAFVTRAVPGDLRVCLRPADFQLIVVDDDDDLVVETSLVGMSFAEGLAWLDTNLAEQGGPEGKLVAAKNELPEHPVQAGEPFRAEDREALAELQRWFANADLVLQGIAEREEGASQVRLWPHHFDLATLISFDVEADPEKARSLGCGFSPGDGTYAEPYFYALPWPAPDAGNLPKLAGKARWHSEGFIAAVLPAAVLLKDSNQAALVRRFFDDVTVKVKDLLRV